MTDTQLYGEPVLLEGRAIYFTSWKYVRQGGFSYQRETAPTAGEATDPIAAALYSSDGPRPARYTPRDIPTGIRLVAQQGQRVPLEGKPLGQQFTVIQDGGRYRAWYGVPPCPDPEPFSTKQHMLHGNNAHVAYAESADGIHWEHPSLGLFEYAGSRDNNLVLRNDLDGSLRGWHGGCVFLDPTSQEERYKMVFLGTISDEEWEAFADKYPGEINFTARRQPMGGYRLVCALCGAVSPDGIHWRNLPEPLLVDHCDTQNTCYYDVDRQLYVAYVRTWQVTPQAEEYAAQFPDSWIAAGRRSIGRAVSRDFRHFTRPEVVVAPGADMAPSHLWYTNGKTALPGCPDQHVLFPWRWELESDEGDCYLFSSADGWAWSQVPGGPVVERGIPGTPDGAYVVCSPNLVELPGERWGIPYHGWPIPHKYPGRDLSKRTGLFPGVPDCQGYAIWPKGRLVALECRDEGSFATVGLVPPGNRIRLNATIRPAGYIRVAVQRLDGEALPGRTFADCDPLVGDGLAMPVTWRGEDYLEQTGAPLRLAFEMRQACLYGVEFI